MQLTELIAALSRPSAYDHPVDRMEVRQTHLSVVFLAGEFAYKLKKPVSFGFVDFTTLAKRRHFCDEEVRLNRRLAPSVYLGVEPVTLGPNGPRLGGTGEPVEWAVKMRRLPDEATLEQRLLRGEVGAAEFEALARRVAAFHAGADGGARIAEFGRFEVVAGNARENFTQSARHVGLTITRPVFERLRTLTESALDGLRPLIETRADRGVPRDTHGDLHLDHVYQFPELEPPDDLLVIDCIEFNERFRFADPVADMAFLAMDLRYHGRPDLAEAFADAYFDATGDHGGRLLLPFYMAYRAAVRGKVEGMKAGESEVPAAAQAEAVTRARAHWLLALNILEEPARRSCLHLIGGLPGTGKTTLARGLAEQAGFHLIRSDVVRKELAGLSFDSSASAACGAGIYTPESTDRTYAECLRRAEERLTNGDRVIVDASFGEEAKRRMFLEAATRLGTPTLLLNCQAKRDVAVARLSARRGDASDADPNVYRYAAERWERLGHLTALNTAVIDTSGKPDQAQSLAITILRQARLGE